MQVNPKLNEIDDCLYRVATKAIALNDGRLLLVKEGSVNYWGFAGGGVDHGETAESSLIRELGEELGLRPDQIATDFQVVHHSFGESGKIPRLNLFYKIIISDDNIRKTNEVSAWGWFTRDEFMEINLSPSYKDRAALAAVIFDK